MTIRQSLEILSNDSSNPCTFIHIESQQLAFVNTAYEKKFQIFEDFTGSHCCDKLKDYSDKCPICAGETAKQGVYPERRVSSKVLNTFLRCNSTIIQVQGQDFLMSKFFMTALDERRASVKQTFESAMTRCLEILALPDRNESIQAFLELLGEFYSCQLTYIYEFDRDKSGLGSQFIWYGEDNKNKIPNTFNQEAMDDFFTWLENDRNKEIISLDYTVADKEEVEEELFQDYDISNITINKLWNKDGSLKGIVGLSNCSEEIYDDRLLRAISRFVVERFNEQSLERALESLNQIDLLTGFYNRVKYAQRLSELHEDRPAKLGVLFVNLNGLRKTNEYFGFEVGDVQLKKTAQTLRQYFSEDFYRISGDEFVCFIPDCEKTSFEKNVDQLQVKLKESNDESSFALGHAWDEGNYNVTNLVKVADTVMVINKQVFYAAALKDSEEVTNTILQDLFRAIAEDEFLVYLQPQIRLSTEEVVGAEALIRRFDKKHQKMIFPDHFIPLYEKNSVIRHVDLFVVRRVCQILQNWKGHGKEMPISVNLSRVTLMEHGIVKTITDICDEYKIDHGLIIIEVTERIGLIENEVASTLVEEFKKEGFKLSLDDFGCAYSNIVTLSQISVDEVKIDKSLVDHVLTNEKNRVIVKNMLAMCHEFENTSTLAEGIETEEQAEFLRSVHCHLGQGYRYSRPIPNEDFFEQYIKEGTKII